MGYSKEALKGVSWVWFLRLLTRLISFLKVAVIARVLTPAQFGLFGIAALILSLVEVLTETGINVFIIQEDEEIESIIDTAWIISILRGIIIFLMIILSIPFVSLFFNTSEPSRLIIFIAFTPLIKGFINPAIIKFQKELMFNREFYFRGSLFVLESVMAIIFVLFLKDPAGIIYGLIFGAIAEVFASFLFVKPTPLFRFDYRKGKKIISRGKWLTASGIFNYLYHNADDAVVGKILGVASLGIYDMAYKISMLPITEIGDVVSKVILPVYIKISTETERLKKAFLKTFMVILFLTLPIGVIFFIFAKEIILIILGPKWIPAVPVFQVLAVFAVIRTTLNPAYSLFLAVKKQEYNTIITFLSFSVMILSIVPLINLYGIVGAGYSVILGSLIAVPPVIYFILKTFRP